MTTGESVDAKAMEIARRSHAHHYSCEDTWYSCPESPEGCSNEAAGPGCDCRLDGKRAELAAAITALVADAVRAERERVGRVANDEEAHHRRHGDHQRVDAVRWLYRKFLADIEADEIRARRQEPSDG